MSSGELPQEKKTLFSTLVQKKQAETDAQKIQNRILQLKMEQEKVLKHIQQDEQRAEEIYRHRVEIQMKKENKMKQKQAQPPPFSLAVSHHQRELLKKIKDDELQRKKSEAKIFRDQLNLEQEGYRIKAIQVKEEERQSTQLAVAKLKQKRERVRYEIENEKDRVEREKELYDLKIQELEQIEQLAMMELQNSLARQQKVQEKIQQAQKLSPSDYENNIKAFRRQVPHNDIYQYFNMLNESLESDKEIDPEKKDKDQ